MSSSNIVVHDIKTAVYDMFWKNEKIYDNILLPECGICSLAIIIVVGLAFKYDVGGGYMDICLGLLCCGTIQLRWGNQDGRRQTSFVYLNQWADVN